jgi:hypothetical protein
MSASAIELPLFPLNVVLFPGVVLPLHIFEPRYRQMIIDCQAEERSFGIVLVQPDSSPLEEIPKRMEVFVRACQSHRKISRTLSPTFLRYGMSRNNTSWNSPRPFNVYARK